MSFEVNPFKQTKAKHFHRGPSFLFISVLTSSMSDIWNKSDIELPTYKQT